MVMVEVSDYHVLPRSGGIRGVVVRERFPQKRDGDGGSHFIQPFALHLSDALPAIPAGGR